MAIKYNCTFLDQTNISKVVEEGPKNITNIGKT